MNDHDLSDLGELEREVLRIVWRLGAASADAVRAEVGKPLKESTVRTVLRRLEAKGHLTHSLSGRTFIYRGAEVRGRAAARAVKRIADWFCEGSVAEVVAGLVDARLLDQKELAELTQKIAKAKGGTRK